MEWKLKLAATSLHFSRSWKPRNVVAHFSGFLSDLLVLQYCYVGLPHIYIKIAFIMQFSRIAVRVLLRYL
jgi:hypothetical protein